MKKLNQGEKGFSLIELIIAMTITLVVLGITVGLFARGLNTRTVESRRTDALTAAQAALNVMSREIGNAGYGLYDETGKIHKNGIVIADSNGTKIRFLSNIVNNNKALDDFGEDVTYYWDSTSKSIVRFDNKIGTPSYIINRVSEVNFLYYDYSGSNSTPTTSTTPSNNTSRVKIILIVKAEPVTGQPSKDVTLSSEVTLRNSDYMINQY